MILSTILGGFGGGSQLAETTGFQLDSEVQESTPESTIQIAVIAWLFPVLGWLPAGWLPKICGLSLTIRRAIAAITRFRPGRNRYLFEFVDINAVP
jgi:hypothetical protein